MNYFVQKQIQCCLRMPSVEVKETIHLATPKATVFGQKQKWKLLFVKLTILVAQPQIAYTFLNDNLDTIWLTILNLLDFFFTNIHNRHLLLCINHTLKPDNGKEEKLTRFYKQRWNINSSGSYTIWGETLWTYPPRCIFNYLLLFILSNIWNIFYFLEQQSVSVFILSSFK